MENVSFHDEPTDAVPMTTTEQVTGLVRRPRPDRGFEDFGWTDNRMTFLSTDIGDSGSSQLPVEQPFESL